MRDMSFKKEALPVRKPFFLRPWQIWSSTGLFPSGRPALGFRIRLLRFCRPLRLPLPEKVTNLYIVLTGRNFSLKMEYIDGVYQYKLKAVATRLLGYSTATGPTEKRLNNLLKNISDI